MYLFISGTPRSGTSAITQLLSAHSSIALGMERYKNLFNPNLVNASLFEEEKFFTYDPSETNVVLKGGQYNEYYKKLKRKYHKSTIRGDKYPFLYKKYHILDETFGSDVTFIYIVREPYRVASSWNVRAKNPQDSWPLKNNYSASVKHWNDANTRTIKAIKKGYNIIVVEYEKLYNRQRNDKYLEHILEELNLRLDEGILEEYKRHIEGYNKIIKDKPLDLDEEEKAFIDKHIDRSLLLTLLES